MIGTELGGYRLEEVIGSGGFGFAYRATKDGETFVVKVLAQNALTITAQKRFDREVKSLQKVDHPYVVRYIDHGEIKLPAGSSFYVVMPFSAGRPLTELATRAPLTEIEVISLAVRIAEGLNAIHAAGIVHRDIKPPNVLLCEDGTPLILDFGIAKLIDYSSITHGGGPGTWRYAAPEQAFDEVDHRSDLYSLGVVMYELLTGTEVFAGSPDLLALLRRVKEETPELPSIRVPGISPALEAVVMRLLQKQPYERYASAADLIGALRQAEAAATIPPAVLATVDRGAGPVAAIHIQGNEGKLLRRYLDATGTVDLAIYGASQLESSRRPVSVALDADVPILIDPETHRFARSDFTRTKGLVNLPYAPDAMTPLSFSDLTTMEQYRSFTERVVDLQVKNRATGIVAPYFFFQDMLSDWRPRNLRLLSETRHVLDERGDARPLWAVISTDAETLCVPDVQSHLVNQYTRTDVDGYLFYVNLADRDANAAVLFNYASTLLRFRDTGRAVLAGRIGSFGLGLYAMGVTGGTSGLTSFESFSWNYYADRANVSGGVQRRYLRPLLQLVSTDIAASIMQSERRDRYICRCPGCVGCVGWNRERLHYLYTRARQYGELQALDPGKRLARFAQWVREAHDEALALNRLGIRVKADHYDTWLLVLGELEQRGLVRAA